MNETNEMMNLGWYGEFWIKNGGFLIYNAAFEGSMFELVDYWARSLSEKGCVPAFSMHISSFWMQNPSFWMQNSSFSIQNSSFLIQSSRVFIRYVRYFQGLFRGICDPVRCERTIFLKNYFSSFFCLIWPMQWSTRSGLWKDSTHRYYVSTS